MRYLVFSDVHANIDALEMIVDEIAALKPDVVVSLGDVVGYGANPGECIDVVQECADRRAGEEVERSLEEAGISRHRPFKRFGDRLDVGETERRDLVPQYLNHRDRGVECDHALRQKR